MKLGRVTIDLGYVVDMDNDEMVDRAKQNLYDDIRTLDNNDELSAWIGVHEDNTLTENDIPEYLTSDKEDDKDEEDDNQ